MDYRDAVVLCEVLGWMTEKDYAAMMHYADWLPSEAPDTLKRFWEALREATR